MDGHLGCVHVLAVANRAAMNIGLFVSFQAVFFPLDTCPGVGLLDCVVALFLVS